MALARILLIDDEPDISTIVKRSLEHEGYEVLTASNGEEGLQVAKSWLPDLILLDVMMEGMDGYEVCTRLKEGISTRFIPVIMLTAKGEVSDRITGIKAGTDDYLVKPFDLKELHAMVVGVLGRTRAQIGANPLTGLPGNPSIEEEIKRRIDRKEDFVVLYLDTDNFKSYNDRYGYAKGDRVIQLTSEIIKEAVEKMGGKDDFIGHIGGDDFIIITSPKRVDNIALRIISRFDELIPYEYKEEDRSLGYIKTKDRRGRERRYPLMTISVAGVTNIKGRITHYGEISELGAELKRYAKSKPGSVYVKDRRRQIKQINESGRSSMVEHEPSKLGT